MPSRSRRRSPAASCWRISRRKSARSSSRRTTPATTAASRSRSSRRGCSRSTAPTARARPAAVSARGCASTRRSSFRICRSPSSTAASPRAAGTASRMRASAGCITTRWRKNITLTLQRPSVSCRSTCARSCSTARGTRSSPCIMIPTAAPACCAARLRASSATLSAAIRRRRAMPCAHRLRTAWRRRPARTATARVCGRRFWPSRSAG